MKTLEFRTAKIEDIAHIVTLVNSAYRGETSKQGWTTEADLLDGQRTDAGKIAEIIADNLQILIVGFAEERMVSSVNLSQKDGRCYLGMLTVDPQGQAQGWGRQTIAAAENFAQKNWNFHVMHMTVISVRQELIAYYLRRGYLPTGEQIEFPMNDPRFGIPKRQDFHLMVLSKLLPSAEN